jgi:3-hydroxyisobutyrate dehydrogenase-like beta-hydroxyacid dehydrogenase
VNERAGFVGLGSMGEPMARALRHAGFTVTACAHRRREALERLIAQDGVTEANDPAAVGRAVDVAFVCVPDAPQVEDALFGERGLADGLQPGSVVIDCSTISPIASRSFAGRLGECGIAFVDAPVSGGPARAKAGTLTIMAGGEPDVYERVRPLLTAMGTPHRVGGIGMGETVKLVNQVVIANIMVANAEALTFAERSGADLGVVREILKSATVSNYFHEQW